MAGVTKKVERIPPPSSSGKLGLLSSSSPLSLLPSLSSYHSLFSPLHHGCRRPPTCSRRRLEYSGAGAASSSRYTPPGVLSPFFLSLSLSLSLSPPTSSPRLSLSLSLPLAHLRWVAGTRPISLSLSLLALASTKWEKPQPPPKPRLRPGHRLPPSFHSPPLPPSLSPPSLPSTYLSLSPSLLPSRVVVFTAGHRCRPRPSDGHLPPPPQPFPSPLLPSLPPLLSPLRLDGHRAPLHPSLAPPPRMQPKGRGPQATRHRPRRRPLLPLPPSLSFLPLSSPSLLCSLSIVEAGDAGEGSPYFTNHTAPLFPQFCYLLFYFILFSFISLSNSLHRSLSLSLPFPLSMPHLL